MGDPAPQTRPSLLMRLRDPGDRDAWGLFLETYSPPIYAFLRRAGLQDADAADLLQEVLAKLTFKLPEFTYAPERGAFKGWLFALTRNHLLDHLKSPRRRERGAGGSEALARLAEQPDRHEELEEVWEQEYQKNLLKRAADRVREAVSERQWWSWEWTAVEGRDPAAVAEALGASLATVYRDRHHVSRLLREAVRELGGD